MRAIGNFLKNETVLAASFLLAAVSAFFVLPGQEYLEYIDWRTLALLFCLMAVMGGLNRLGVFHALAEGLLRRVHSVRGLALTLITLCYFSSLVVTNDVALITFVPFSIVALRASGQTKRLVPLVTLETVAANLGSMLTPIGNPQNLYLFSAYAMTPSDFFCMVAPYGLMSLLLLAIAGWLMGSERLDAPCAEQKNSPDKKYCLLYGVLFLLALLTVFRVLPWPLLLAVTLAALLITDRKTFARVDYSLLLTFIFLFIFIGNLGRIAPVSDLLRRIVTGREVITGVLASQVLSNVPAAILLSGFTSNGQALLVGVNLGGLGTLIASMASLISYKFVVGAKQNTGRYILVFTVVNILFLAANIGLWLIM